MYTAIHGGFLVHTCGVCGMGFLRQDVLRLHTATPDLRDPRTGLGGALAQYQDFETHDGEPWGAERLVVGARLPWFADGIDGPSKAVAEPVTVIEVAESRRNAGLWFVLLDGVSGRRWHEIEDVVAACFPAGRGGLRSSEHAGGVLDGARVVAGRVVHARDEVLGIAPADGGGPSSLDAVMEQRFLDLPVTFGLTDTKAARVAVLLQEGRSWEEIGRDVGWEPATLKQHWERRQHAGNTP